MSGKRPWSFLLLACMFALLGTANAALLWPSARGNGTTARSLLLALGDKLRGGAKNSLSASLPADGEPAPGTWVLDPSK